jgi:glucoamylase
VSPVRCVVEVVRTTIPTPIESQAPGHPGTPPRRTSGAKSDVGASLQAASRVWFTLSHGIVNEIFTRGSIKPAVVTWEALSLMVTLSSLEGKRHTSSQMTSLAAGAPAYRVVNTCRQGRYRIEKEIVCDPQRDEETRKWERNHTSALMHRPVSSADVFLLMCA